ncbi:MAG: MBL fold metallo-hydrolase [Actinobacteria bacterium]|jgi:L-ascorbate metabolism protein UlaG (beta-lactamase superfamily)|nr:MBL fold metallo-hydrolase [Actinomycetota bacterium]
MRCFRLSHAGLVLERENASLFIDPGNFSTERELSTALESAPEPAGIVITHEHADHFTPEHVRAILAISPNAPIFTTAATAAALETAGITGAIVAREGDTHEAGPFTLEFYGRRHEVLHSSIPVIDNLGVRVNGTLAWGGDSLTRPPFAADMLGVPIGSPWSNIAQVMDFTLGAAPRRVFLTHDGMLSSRGLELFTERVRSCLAQFGGELVTIPRIDEDPAARLELDI